MATIRDVAKACGVSAMTVSAVLNNRPGFASAETRRRVLAAVEEMGYQPNAVARGLTRRRMNTLGLVMSYEGKGSLTSDRYFSPILDGIFAASKEQHQKALVITEDNWSAAEANLLSYLDGHCDGLIFVLPLIRSEAFHPLVKRQVPFVLIGEARPEEFLSVVDLDNRQAAMDAVNHLLEQGHRRIGFLRGDDFLLSSWERQEGYHKALSQAGIVSDDRWVLGGRYSVSSGYERMQQLLALPAEERPTALFCGDDSIALGAWQALRECGIRVPEEMSLIGINDDQDAMSAPGLTTVRQPLRRIGETAVEMILSQLSGERPGGEKKLLPGALIFRGSVAPPFAA